MKIAATVAFLQLCLSATASVSENNPTETVVTAEPGDVVLLSCYTGGNATPSSTSWTKNGEKVGDSSNPRLAVLQDGSLRFDVVKAGDEGSYLCNTTLPDSSIFQARARLQLNSGPGMSIFPATLLPNGTLVANQGTVVYFRCSASSSPSQRLSLTFSGRPSSNDTLSSTSLSSLDFKVENIQRGSQGVYTCSAVDSVSKWAVNRSTELLVYYVPETHPDCMWVPSQNPSDVQLNCSWFGAYPAPKLRWGEAGDFQETENLSVTLSVSDGQTLTCSAKHQLLRDGNERSCSLSLKSPYPAGDPMVTAVEGTRVTLTCTETTAFPPANTTWKRGVQKEKTDIEPGPKYVLSDKGPDYKLTVLNVSKEDEGCYYCRSQNQLGYKYLEICLTVKTSSSVYTGGIIGVLIASLIVGAAVIIAKALYSRRHQICLGGGYGDEDRDDVLSLVESDDERIFQDTVPQLPPLANGRHTTLVEVHRIPSCVQEEAGPAEPSPPQPEDPEHTEQEDLVTF